MLALAEPFDAGQSANDDQQPCRSRRGVTGTRPIPEIDLNHVWRSGALIRFKAHQVRAYVMHEMAVCNELLDQVRANVLKHGAKSVGSITVRIGALSGVEPDLLQRAFTIARAGAYTDNARLIIETVAVRVRCRSCSNENDAAPNRLLCDACGGYAVDLIGGDELLLASLELHGMPDAARSEQGQRSKDEISEGEDSYV